MPQSQRLVKLQCLLVLATIGILHCATIRSHSYMKPHASGMQRTSGKLGPGGRLQVGSAIIELRTIAMGTHRTAIGPCLFPFLPGSKEWPRGLTLEVANHGDAAITIFPGQWVVRARAREFGKTFFAADIFTNHQAYAASVFPDLTSHKMRDVLLKNQGSGLVLAPRSRAWIKYGLFDNRFVDVVLKKVVVQMQGKQHTLPDIRFSRHSNWHYKPFTLAPLFPYPR